MVPVNCKGKNAVMIDIDRMMGGPLWESHLAGKTLVPVGEDVGVFVVLPRVEDFTDVKIVSVVASGGQIHHERRLEVNFVVTIVAVLVPENIDDIKFCQTAAATLLVSTSLFS